MNIAAATGVGKLNDAPSARSGRGISGIVRGG
jgi:hypothetical protein